MAYFAMMETLQLQQIIPIRNLWKQHHSAYIWVLLLVTHRSSLLAGPCSQAGGVVAFLSYPVESWLFRSALTNSILCLAWKEHMNTPTISFCLHLCKAQTLRQAILHCSDYSWAANSVQSQNIIFPLKKLPGACKVCWNPCQSEFSTLPLPYRFARLLSKFLTHLIVAVPWNIRNFILVIVFSKQSDINFVFPIDSVHLATLIFLFFLFHISVVMGKPLHLH